ncbi:hypothetical protein [Chryseobacterium bernardetii]|uniref:hypothetical protein n=1 Tax=Chryseobacterium bernardetii TaxID=1241978 RepID=UPI001623A950|nr:hypothetical protein [Chryseobacterium bernardetii]
MITYKNCTRKQKNALTCIASYLLYNVIRDRLEEFKKISNLFYKEHKNSVNEHYNLYESRHGALDVAFDLTLTEEEKEITKVSDDLWDAFFKIYHVQEKLFNYSKLIDDSMANERAAEKILNEWETFLLGYRCANNKNVDHETAH